MEYLAAQGLEADPWRHQVLYEVFPLYLERYRPSLPDEEKRAFWVDFTGLLFEVTRVRGPGADDPAAHADGIGGIFGSQCLEPFEDAVPTLEALKAQGCPVAIVSNWPPGLAFFCEELGLLSHVKAAVSSAEVRYFKPDPRLFYCAQEEFDVPHAEILHVGDSPDEDVAGARAAGFQVRLLARDGPPPDGAPHVRSLREVPALVGQEA